MTPGAGEGCTMVLNNYSSVLRHLSVEKKAGLTDLNIIYHYHVFTNSSKKHLPVKKIAFYFTHETSPYECSIINQAIMQCEMLLQDQQFALEYYAYPLTTDVIRAQDTIIDSVAQNGDLFDLVVPIGDFVALACRDTEHKFDRVQNYIFMNVLAPLESGVTGIFGECLDNSSAVLPERPEQYPILHFMGNYMEHIKRVLVPHDEHCIPAYGFINNFSIALEDFGYKVERLPLFTGKQKQGSALNYIKSFDAVVINDDSTTSRSEVRKLADLCAINSTTLLATDATSIFLGASIGFGNPGDMYGVPLAHKIAQFFQGMSLNDIDITRVPEDNGLCFNSTAIEQQAVPLSDAAYAALNAQDVAEKFKESREILS